jgi:hypothetical protein
MIVNLNQPSHMLESRHPEERIAIRFSHARRHFRVPQAQRYQSAPTLCGAFAAPKLKSADSYRPHILLGAISRSGASGVAVRD